jgi:acyl-coenzyme A synthetase/AMP-(fatty) acid ligase
MGGYLRVDQVIDAATAATPDKVALVCGARRWTYGELAAERDRRAGVLVEAGLGAGDRLLLTERTSDDYIITLLACARAGGILAMLSPLLAEPELVALAGRLAPRVACTATGLPHPALAAVTTLPLALPGVPAAAALREAARRAATGTADAPCVIRGTSGSTGGRAKLVLRPHRQITWRCGANPWPARPDSVYCCPATNHLMPSETSRTFALGATLVVPRAVGINGLEQELAEQGVTVILLTPALLGALARQETPPPPALCLEVARTIGAALPGEVKRAAEARYRVPVYEEYGMAECSAIMRSPGPGTPVGSVGKPNPGVAVRLLDSAGNAVPEGALGELVLRSPGLMLGYLDDPEANAVALRDGWYHTGDNARRDEQGYYFILGRRGLQINVGGMKVAPEEVEAVLLQHPGVREVVVVPQPDALRGEVVRAIVVPEGEVPDFWHEPLPRSALGKVLRQRL